MTEKLVPIGDHKEKDAIFLREFLLGVIRDKKLKESATGQKVRVEAAKNLARLQHLLQVDKKIERISPQEKKKNEELTPSQLADVNELLNAN